MWRVSFARTEAGQPGCHGMMAIIIITFIIIIIIIIITCCWSARAEKRSVSTWISGGIKRRTVSLPKDYFIRGFASGRHDKYNTYGKGGRRELELTDQTCLKILQVYAFNSIKKLTCCSSLRNLRGQTPWCLTKMLHFFHVQM
jgi:hypothetical protein